MNVDPRFVGNATGAAGQPAVKLQVSQAERLSAPTPATATLEALLSLEGELRSVANADAFGFFVTNETRRIIASDLTVYLRTRPGGGRFTVRAVSSVSSVEAHAPGIAGLETLAAQLFGALGQSPVTIAPLLQEQRVAEFPYAHALVMRLQSKAGNVPGLILLLRNQPFADRDRVLAERLSQTYAYVLENLSPARFGAGALAMVRRRSVQAGIALLVLCLLAIPVPMSALAPAEVVAQSPVVVTASLDGVIASVEVEPNRPVEQGTVLVRYNDTDLSGRLAIAERALDLAAARHQRVMQGASQSQDLRREIAVTEAELDLARAERDEALALLSRTVIRAPSPGIAIFASRDDWTGRPVATGERIMEIGDPDRVEIEIEVGLGDSVVLAEGASVWLFADQDPLNPLRATVERASYRAEAMEAGRLAYRVRARLAEDDDGEGSPLRRIGVRGTARITHGRVSLGHYLLRRPLSQWRQWSGL